MDYIVKVGLEGFTEQEIRDAMKSTWWWAIGKLTAADYDGVVEYMKESWADFPPDKYIHETSSEVWLRKEEIDCNVCAYYNKKVGLEYQKKGW